MEVLVVVVIALILLGITLGGLVSFRRARVLDESVSRVTAALLEARSLTLLSQNASQYGVHFASSDVTRFAGTMYVPSDPSNVVVTLSPAVVISDITLEGGGADLVFNRLTGETDQFGTVTFELVVDETKTRSISVTETGLVEVQ